ncbi:probable phenylalanine--tRNA ligase, mitochondrial [Diorhabda sublineata]|uniref:probable phenylalanine--tRNA ligase, mitochondrial n=1 Tax=Diorhabda sublineata TaxID=1163346 RepID=UPI0024E0674E|nr:probable phenylalanine--tRNA ligase, mitochondrial [Diorhabda sublineata]XP_056633535.1 probable phenylalanine--tRNA ligase, mitochondrial [Diorhabda sublineata]XP_056633536.1 probable phenylalanine--tRNA ligase, mitochondrial [Diorhabda sublineata]XP_056633538.1 probable phenylalanine--tRNA ligase, mitochondrial [Diorhabda sublineata]XP_056633539.1 probable phenylalanine--tRNA ligase, mitochondrial [Diorhabda sublineata]
MLKLSNTLLIQQWTIQINRRFLSKVELKTNDVVLLNQNYLRDEYTNITEKVCGYIGKNIYLKDYHPLSLVRQRIVNYFYNTYVNRRGNPIFSIHDNLSPVVNVNQNFDSLLIPKNHRSRSKSDCYYINKIYMLRAHMTAHQSELIQSGLNNFLIIGDVYRRDEIDSTHYPVFHQVDAVRLRCREEIFLKNENLNIFEEGNNTSFTGNQEKQACHTLEAVKLVEYELKETLFALAKQLFGKNVKCRWVDTTFPFTQPSWELEVFHNDQWIEVLGCGIMQQAILNNGGVTDKIGWAFGIGLERIAMCLYKIPDIRLFWSTDSGFLNQFKNKNVDDSIIYTPVSQYPQCKNDLSFWIPPGEFSSNDFYDLARNIGGDLIEQIELIDEFTHKKTGKISHCYRITYRHMEKTLTQEEVNAVHKDIANKVEEIGGTVR